MNQSSASGLLLAGVKLPLGRFVLDLGSEELRDDEGGIVALRPQAFAVLRHLALNTGRMVGKEELLDAVWPGRVVTDGSLVQAIGAVREALGDAGQRLLKTVPRRGYLLVADALTPPDTARVPDSPSIAVLAFRDPSGDRDGELLARGVATDLVAELARNIDIRVISHHSSFVFADGTTPVAEIGRVLRCRHLVGGSVQRSGETLRIDVELIDSEGGHVVWNARHVVDHSTVLEQRDALVRRIAGTLHNSARHAGSRSVLSRPPKTLDAYALSARAVALRINYIDLRAMRDARELLERALAIDPDYVPACAYLAELTGCQALLGLPDDRALQREAEALARRTLALDPEHPVAYRVLSYVHLLRREFDAQLAAARRAVELSPSNADQLFGLAMALVRGGQEAAGLEVSQASMAMHPLPPVWVMAMHAEAVWACGGLDEALALADTVLVKEPGYLFARIVRIYALVELGRIDEARRTAAPLVEHAPWCGADWVRRRHGDAARASVERRIAALRAAGID